MVPQTGAVRQGPRTIPRSVLTDGGRKSQLGFALRRVVHTGLRGGAAILPATRRGDLVRLLTGYGFEVVETRSVAWVGGSGIG